jgi:hypothetical protein
MLAALSAAVLVLLAAADPVLASCQGLYFVTPVAGQLMLTNWTTGAGVAVGESLASQGWGAFGTCSPSAVDQTGKWSYALARVNASSPLRCGDSWWGGSLRTCVCGCACVQVTDVRLGT